MLRLPWGHAKVAFLTLNVPTLVVWDRSVGVHVSVQSCFFTNCDPETLSEPTR